MSAVANHPLLSGLPAGVGERLAGCAPEVQVASDTLLFRTGEPADGFYLVVAGQIALEVAPPAGAPLVVETVGPGSVVGWSWLLPPHRWQFDGRALSDVTVFRVDARCARAAMAADAEVAVALLERFLRVVAERLWHTRIQLLDVYGHVRAD